MTSSIDTIPHRLWTAQYGGILTDQRQDRLKQTCERLTLRRHFLHLKPYVLNTHDLAAYSWPDGSLFVTQGLIDATDSDELAAVIAHEAGHLIAHHASQSTTMLRGRKNRLGVETQADQLGCAVLQECGIPPAAMLRMLRKVKQSTMPKAPSYQLLCDRVKRLETSQK